MYKSKFTSTNNNHHHQDPWRQGHDHHDPRNYRSDPRNYRHGPGNPWNERHYNHQDPRYYRYGSGHHWNDPREKMHKMNTSKGTTLNEKEKDLLRRGFLQLIIGVLIVQYLTYHVTMANHQYSYRSGCQCKKCLMMRLEEVDQSVPLKTY